MDTECDGFEKLARFKYANQHMYAQLFLLSNRCIKTETTTVKWQMNPVIIQLFFLMDSVFILLELV